MYQVVNDICKKEITQNLNGRIDRAKAWIEGKQSSLRSPRPPYHLIARSRETGAFM